MAQVDLSGIKDNVAKIKSLIPAAKAAFDQLAAKIQELIDASTGDTVDKAELQQVADDLTAEAADLAAAIPAGTPQDPNP